MNRQLSAILGIAILFIIPLIMVAVSYTHLDVYKRQIVTNKPRRFTQRLIESIGLHRRAACIVSGDDAAKPKPSPETLLLACRQVGVKPQACVYVGDAERDVVAAKAAGMKTVVALFGYIDDVSDKPHEWGADALIQTPIELLDLLTDNVLFSTACAPIAS